MGGVVGVVFGVVGVVFGVVGVVLGMKLKQEISLSYNSLHLLS